MSNTALSITALAVSANALQEATDARATAECVAIMQRFDPKAASVAETQHYAACVQRVLPAVGSRAPFPQEAAAVLLFAILLGAGVGARFAWQEGDGIGGWLLYSLAGVIACVLALFVLVGLALLVGTALGY